MPGDEVVGAAGDLDQLGQRPHAVGGRVLRLEVFVELRLQPGDADLEELVEVRRADRQEPQPLEQRVRRVARLFEHALVEIEPAQLAIDEPARVEDRRRGSRRRRDRDRLTVRLELCRHDHALRRGLTPAIGRSARHRRRRLAEGSMKRRFRSISRVSGARAGRTSCRRTLRLRASRSSPSSIPLGVSRIIGKSRNRESLTR